ncbi:MAG: lactonase family protein [Parabacteroides sp.]|nr:lactonase family protein [Parabacteroides sp.]
MRKIFILFIGILLSAATCFGAGNDLFMLIGCMAEPSQPGMYLYRFDEASGKAILLRKVNQIANPTYINFTKDGRNLYAVSETQDGKAKLYSYVFNNKNGNIRLLNYQLTHGDNPCNVWIDADKSLAVTANYFGGSITAFPLQRDGRLHKGKLFQFEGGDPKSARQEQPHLHCIYTSPDNLYLYANDLGTDQIYKYDLVENKAQHTLSLKKGTPASFKLPAGEGPRHTEFHQNGKFAYIIGELSGNVTVLKYNKGNLTPIQTIIADTLNAAGSADIHVAPDGRFLYVSNRLKGDGIAIFSINVKTGLLTKIGYQLTGLHPRNFIITPNGKFLLCACRDSNVVQIYTINKENGLLTSIHNDISISKPMCVKFTEIHETYQNK